MNITTIHSPKITSFSPIVDASWIKSQLHLNEEIVRSRLKKGELNNSFFIFNEATNYRYSLIELANSLSKKILNIKYDKESSYNETLINLYLEFKSDNFILKLKGYNLTYILKQPTKTILEVDIEKQILGIMHNYITGRKNFIFKNGNIKQLDL